MDAKSTLPDKTEVSGADDLKRYLGEDRIDQVAFSVLKHLATYAAGRTLTYNELDYLKRDGLKLKAGGYRMKDMVRYVVNSKVFLEKVTDTELEIPMNRSLRLDRRAFLRGLGRSCPGAAGSRRHGRRSDRPDSAPFLRHLHRQRHVAAENRARHRRVELVPQPRNAAATSCSASPPNRSLRSASS